MHLCLADLVAGNQEGTLPTLHPPHSYWSRMQAAKTGVGPRADDPDKQIALHSHPLDCNEVRPRCALYPQDLTSFGINQHPIFPD